MVQNDAGPPHLHRGRNQGRRGKEVIWRESEADSKVSRLEEVKSKKIPKKLPFTIRTEEDLDLLLQQHPTLAALPESSEHTRQMKVESTGRYVYLLLDSGASIHAAKM